jgi:hypothetical protein
MAQAVLEAPRADANRANLRGAALQPVCRICRAPAVRQISPARTRLCDGSRVLRATAVCRSCAESGLFVVSALRPGGAFQRSAGLEPARPA